MDSSKELAERVDNLEKELAAANSKISDLHRRNKIMDERILETLTGFNKDFENRVVQAVNEAKRKGVSV